jgi:hypothetical protein
MRRRSMFLLALPLALACAGCGDGRSYAPWPPRAVVGPWSAPEWRAIAAGLRPAADPRSPNVCTRGGPACMQAVVAEMTQRLERLAATCDHLAPFAVMYRQVSREVRSSVRARRYRDPGYVAHLDAVFATLYFRALDDWRLGRRDEVPRAWRVAFSAAEGRRVTALGDLLLGMNAHISRDLPYALAAVGLRLAGGGDAVPDVVDVNGDILPAQDAMLDEVARRFDPTVRTATAISPTGDPEEVAETIAAWRLEAVDNARRLLAARTRVERRRVDTEIDANATLRALLIRDETSYDDPVRQAESRRRYCLAARSSPG